MKTIYSGIWWLPEDDKNVVTGNLIIEEDKINLETIGAIVSSDKPLYVPYAPVIWGKTSDAKNVSLFNCHIRFSKNLSCPFSTTNCSVQLVVVGEHIRSLDTVGDYDVKAHIDELSSWFVPNAIIHEVSNGNYSWLLNINPHNVSVNIEDGCNIKLSGECEYHSKDFNVELTQRSTLNFLYSKQISIKDAKSKIFAFEQFLSFVSLTPVRYKRFFLIDKEKQKDKTKNCSIEILECRNNQYDYKRNKNYFLFDYNMIESKFSEVIKKWYAEKELFPIRAHLIDSIDHHGIFSSNEFLIVAQAIDGYYCRFVNDNEKFSVCLEKLRDEFSDIKKVELNDDDIKCIVDSRHHYSHLLMSGKKHHVLDGHELYELNHKLRKLLICCILSFVGFNNDEINEIFANSNSPYLA